MGGSADGAKPTPQHQRKGPDACHHISSCTDALLEGDACGCLLRTGHGR
jgi:hypothetical protein